MICCCGVPARHQYFSVKEGVLIPTVNSESNVSRSSRFAWSYGKKARLPCLLERGIRNDSTLSSSGLQCLPTFWQVAPANTACSKIRYNLLASCLFPGYCSSVEEEDDDKTSSAENGITQCSLTGKLDSFGIPSHTRQSPSTREIIKLNIFPQTSPGEQGFALIIARCKGRDKQSILMHGLRKPVQILLGSYTEHIWKIYCL